MLRDTAAEESESVWDGRVRRLSGIRGGGYQIGPRAWGSRRATGDDMGPLEGRDKVKGRTCKRSIGLCCAAVGGR